MSKTDQTTVAEWAGDDESDAAAGGQPAWEPGDGDDVQRSCEQCGAHISARYHRYHADEDGDVHCCPECSTQPERYAGKATDPDRSVRKTMALRTVV